MKTPRGRRPPPAARNKQLDLVKEQQLRAIDHGRTRHKPETNTTSEDGPAYSPKVKPDVKA